MPLFINLRAHCALAHYVSASSNKAYGNYRITKVPQSQPMPLGARLIRLIFEPRLSLPLCQRSFFFNSTPT